MMVELTLKRKYPKMGQEDKILTPSTANIITALKSANINLASR